MIKKLMLWFVEWKARYDDKQYNKGYKLATEYCKAKSKNMEIRGKPVKKETHYQISEEVEKIELGGMCGTGFKQAVIDFNDAL